MILEYRGIPPRHNRDELRVSVEFCNNTEQHSNHFKYVRGRIIWCRGILVDSFPLCQVAHPEVREVLPCKHKESGGYQCENLEPHTDEHKFGEHTVRHSLSGNGWRCEDIEESS